MEAATAGRKAVYVNRKQFDGESNLMYRIESHRPAEGGQGLICILCGRGIGDGTETNNSTDLAQKSILPSWSERLHTHS
ncbi:MAG TPA: hypothetical protein VF077_04800, partial [Nitrospiraceae bacterium]